MCDFSEYGGPTEDWLAIERELPARAFDISLQPEVLKKVVNDGREELAAKAMEVLGPKVTIRDYKIPTRDGSSIEARSYRVNSNDPSEKLPVFIFYHGGGWLFGSLLTEDATCANIAINTRVLVLNVNYRHTPEHIFPTAWNDAQDAYAWVQQNIQDLGGIAEKVVVGGISAGGSLSASMVLEQRIGKALTEYPPIAGQVLMIPCVARLDHYNQLVIPHMKSKAISSYVENEDAPLLPVKVVQYFFDHLKIDTHDLRDTKLNIISATDEEVKGMPPSVFGIAGLDPLRDEAMLYAKKLAEAGVPTDVHLFKGMPHGARRFGDQLKVNKAWDEVLQQGILWCLQNPLPSGKFEVKVR